MLQTEGLHINGNQKLIYMAFKVAYANKLKYCYGFVNCYTILIYRLYVIESVESTKPCYKV